MHFLQSAFACGSGHIAGFVLLGFNFLGQFKEEDFKKYQMSLPIQDKVRENVLHSSIGPFLCCFTEQQANIFIYLLAVFQVKLTDFNDL